MNTMIEKMKAYKDNERYAHVSIDDVLNKVTQEVAELAVAKKDVQISEMYSEAGDTVVNILSVALELGCDLDDLQDITTGQVTDIVLLKMLGDWNTKIQGLRNRYTREDGDREQVEEMTKRFVTTVLSYADPCIHLGSVIENNTQKFMQRKDQYKPDINPRDYIAEYPDFPKAGINFKDISPLLANPDALRFVCHEMAEKCRGADKIVALDARGFIFAPIIGQILGIPWIMARKPGKLPGEVESISYDLEYGSNTIEIQKGSIEEGENVAVVDDLLATGGTAMAAIKLIEELGGIVSHAAFVIGLDEEFLLGQETRKDLEKYPYSAVISYD